MRSTPVIRVATLLFLIFNLVACASIDEKALALKVPSYHLGYQTDSQLSQYFNPENVEFQNETGFYPLTRGHDALLARLALIEAAEHSLDVQYYIYRNDQTSKLITWKLIEAAQRGVRVRLLLDDMQKRSDDDLATLNTHPNIDVRLFNPHQYRQARTTAFVKDFNRLNSRMHNKSLTADSVVSIVGGRNIGNEYFSFQSEVQFGDFDLLLYGNTVAQTADQFDLYWNSDYAIPMALINSDSTTIPDHAWEPSIQGLKLEEKFTQGAYNLKTLSFYEQLHSGTLPLAWGEAELWYDLPEKISTSESALMLSLSSLLSEVESSLVIISPYFVPTQTGVDALVNAVAQGKDITILTNSLASNDVFAVHGWYAKYRQALVEGGVKLWEIKSTAKFKSKWSMTGSDRASLHAKVILVDEKKLFVGSMNFDPRSANLNTEMAVVIEQPDYVSNTLETMPLILSQYAYKVEVKDGNVIWLDTTTGETLTKEPAASILLRMGAWMAGILPIEDLL